MIKTYQLINDINLTTPVLCGGKAIMISFTGGMRNSGETLRHGQFTTSDEELQKALEADRGYGRVFRCITPVPVTEKDNPPTKPQTVETQSVAAEVAVDTSSEEETAETSETAETEDVATTESENAPAQDDTVEVVSGVTNKQQALEWLAANRNIDGLKPTCRAEAVRNAAALHGVSFPDWK